MEKNIVILGIIIFLAFFIRVYNLPFPAFTADEARIAYRGYTLANLGKDEMGRTFPVIFNSLSDYQLPVTSYLAAFGEFFLGKTDLGARVPFIVLGTILIFIIYKVTKLLNDKEEVALLAAGIGAFSPPLIFLSKIPNETIILTFLLMLVFYLLLQKKVKFWQIGIMITLGVFTSKFSWFIMPFFVTFTLFFCADKFLQKKNIILILYSLIISSLAITLFIGIPQGKRSLSENNFSIFNNVTIANGINRLKGQGMQSGWPSVLDRALFNKASYIPVGLLHWLSHIQPAFYFGQLDEKGIINFPRMGGFASILLIPALMGLFSLLKSFEKKWKILTTFFLFTFPATFIYPKYSLELVVLTLPIMAIIIAMGFLHLPRILAVVILFVSVAQVMVQVINPFPNIRITNFQRPVWIKQVVNYVENISKEEQLIMSDDITDDNTPFIEWYSKFNPEDGFLAEQYPYRIRQTSLKNINMHGFDKTANICSVKEKTQLIISKRDLQLIEDRFDLINLKKFQDSFDRDIAYSLSSRLCLNR
ncbi:MAG: Glycosyl transferase family 39 [Berkelbacteria bacterium GW2011_GWA1_36_9]|uniref:Glycosyl transferase family 39 n=1 Tax=Berkelbacteria bacterium GW2011_GWA1_36_9 TaxID=1618331 RepID=A0A0G0FXA3_9BACT|nr:MAG: Glycosyl transferase family 39 [Berkelbacteria bacterium GW2011_GWA1_36_9]